MADAASVTTVKGANLELVDLRAVPSASLATSCYVPRNLLLGRRCLHVNQNHTHGQQMRYNLFTFGIYLHFTYVYK